MPCAPNGENWEAFYDRSKSAWYVEVLQAGMYVCMYVCAYVQMYLCMCRSKSAWYVEVLQARMYVCMYVCIYVHMCRCTYVCVDRSLLGT